MSGNRIADIGNLVNDYKQKQLLSELESLVTQYKRHDSLDPWIYTCVVIAAVTGIYCPVAVMLEARNAVTVMLGIIFIVSMFVMIALRVIRNHRLDKSTIQARIIADAQMLQNAELRTLYMSFGMHPDSLGNIL